jgi:AcrR family transcriptional regulator
MPAASARRVRLTAELRRQHIVEAAFKSIAEEGFEGLRTRDIAAAVGINSATLHHHFPTKDDLIAGVAAHLESRFRSEKTATRDDTPEFARQFEDVVLYHLQKPDMLAVYREFVARAPRDPAIAALVARLHAGWRESVTVALRRGRADGSLRADLDIDAAASIVLSTAWGLVSGILASPDDLATAASQLTSWMRRA